MDARSKQQFPFPSVEMSARSLLITTQQPIMKLILTNIVKLGIACDREYMDSQGCESQNKFRGNAFED